MKRLFSYILIFTLAITALSGCAGDTSDIQVIVDETNPASTSPESTSPDSAAFETTMPEEQQLAFGKALWDIYQKQVLPNGHPLEPNFFDDTRNNKFALIDVDGDSKEELLLAWVSGVSMAGTIGAIMGYEDGNVHVELLEFPSMHIYDNGIIEADWSHNQGYAGSFWPYTAYKYDEASDTYQKIGYVDAWDKSFTENVENIAPFPTDIDADGDGFIYYLYPADADWGNTSPVDGDVYEEWRNSYLGDATELSLPFQDLTEENIALLGYPKPELEIQEPVG